MTLTLAALCGFAFIAGFVDAVAGGGGLIQVPALLVLMPQLPIATVFGTNKFASIWGTGAAAIQYSRHVPIEWRTILPTAFSALVFGFLGAHTVSLLSPAILRPLVLCLLLTTLVYTVWKKDLGALHAPKLRPSAQIWLGMLTGAALGFYDGFFGPGTGSFLIFAFVGLFGFSFLAASAAAKIINVVTNLAAITYFSWSGNILYGTALSMAVCNTAGGWLGSHMAIRRGNGFVRGLMMMVVCMLLLKLTYDTFIKAP